jgi:hypothetical protein
MQNLRILKLNTMKWTYHTSHSYKDKDGKEYSFQSQLYQVGVYGIINGDPSMQMNIPPSALVKMEKKLKEQEKKGEIVDLVFGREITVTDDDSLYKEVK